MRLEWKILLNRNSNIVVFAICLLGAGLVSVMMGADVNWDLRNYHLYNAYAFLNDRFFLDIAPAQRQSYFNPLLDIPFYWLVTTIPESPRLIAFLLGAVHGINIFLVLQIGRLAFRTESNSTGKVYIMAALLIGITGAATVPVIGTTMNELQPTVLVMFGLYLIVRFTENLSEERVPMAILCAGFVIGMSAGLKLTYAVYLVGLGFAVLSTGRDVPRAVWLFLVFSIGSLVGLAVTHGFWSWKLHWAYGNPVFPFFNNLFLSPYAEPVACADERFLPRNWKQMLLYPMYWVVSNAGLVTELQFRDARYATVFATIIGAGSVIAVRQWKGERAWPDGPMGRMRRQKIWRVLVVFWVASYVTWLQLFSIFRYTAPLELISGVLIVGMVGLLFNWSWVSRIITVAIVLLLGITTLYPAWGRDTFGDRYLEVQVPGLPANSLVLLLGDNPMAYVIPYIRSDARFLGLDNNLVNRHQDNLLQQRIDYLIKHHDGSFFSIEPGVLNQGFDAGLLPHYQLVRESGSCQPIESSLDRSSLQMCRLSRIINPIVK